MTSLIPPKAQFFDESGDPLVGGKVFFYQAGTSTKQDTYSNLTNTSTNTNPVILDSRGEATISLNSTLRYKVILTRSTDTDPPTNPIWTVDNIPGSATDIYDSNGNLILAFTAATSAVNYVNITNAATGDAPSIAAAGTNTNIDLIIKAKGTGSVNLGQATTTGVVLVADQPISDSSENEYLKFSKTASAVNEITVTNAATGSGPSLSATGGDTNISVTLKGKGTGSVILGQSTSVGVSLAADQPITDSSGNELLKFTKVASAVNEINISNTITNDNPSISATGDDTNIGLDLKSKGTGSFRFRGTATAQAILGLFENTTNGANAMYITPPASIASDRTITLTDSDFTLGTGWELISTSTASNTSSIDFTSISASSFLRYYITGTNIKPTTDNVNLLFRVSAAGSFFSGASDYTSVGSVYTSTPGTATINSTTSAVLINYASNGIGNSTDEYITFRMEISDCTTSTRNKTFLFSSYYLSQDPLHCFVSAGGRFNANTVLDGFRFIMSSGTIDSGTIKLYGLRG